MQLAQDSKYRARVSGPLMDRIDIHIEVPPVRYKELSDETKGEPSVKIRERVNKARESQRRRFEESPIHSNSQMSPKQLKKFVDLGSDSKELLGVAIDRLGLSARAHDRILKVSRTIADLEGSADVNSIHVSEAIQYRSLDRNVL